MDSDTLMIAGVLLIGVGFGVVGVWVWRQFVPRKPPTSTTPHIPRRPRE